jgi:hypothetical protein
VKCIEMVPDSAADREDTTTENGAG